MSVGASFSVWRNSMTLHLALLPGKVIFPDHSGRRYVNISIALTCLSFAVTPTFHSLPGNLSITMTIVNKQLEKSGQINTTR